MESTTEFGDVGHEEGREGVVVSSGDAGQVSVDGYVIPSLNAIVRPLEIMTTVRCTQEQGTQEQQWTPPSVKKRSAI